MSKNLPRHSIVSPISDEPLAKLGRSLDEYKYQEKEEIMGKILTIIDASVTEPQQNKALKDLIKQVFHQELGYWHGLQAMLGHWSEKYRTGLALDDFMKEQMPKYDFSDRI